MNLTKSLDKGPLLGTKKEKVTDENFEESLLKSVNEAIEYTHGERVLRTHIAAYFRMPPRYSKTKIKKIRTGPRVKPVSIR